MRSLGRPGQGVLPRPIPSPFPSRVGVGGTRASFIRAGTLGLPLMVAIIGDKPHRFRHLTDALREAGRRADHTLELLRIGLHMLGYVADSIQQAGDEFYPCYARVFTEIGRERSWLPMTRTHFDALCDPTSTLIFGDADHRPGSIPTEYAEAVLDQGLDRRATGDP